jgi:hypothetical protein
MGMMDAWQVESANETARKQGTEEERSLDAWQEQVEWAWNGRGVDQILSQGAADIYADFLESMFFYYGENTRAAERATEAG